MSGTVVTGMEIVALFVTAFLQLASLSLDPLRETIQAIATALAQQYVASEALDVAIRIATRK